MMSKRNWLVMLSIMSLGAGLQAAEHFVSGVSAPSAQRATVRPASADNASPRPPLSMVMSARASWDFPALVEQYGPSVVNVSVLRGARKVSTGSEAADANPVYELLRRFGIAVPGNEGPTGGIGSGFIVSSDGIILTNAHVVAGADEVTVKLTDRREFRATVLGVDAASDVAALKIDASGLPAVKIGDPEKVRVGEPVLVIGSPFGFENTVTSGIVSAKARALPDGTYVPFIQTDAAVNPGNSGGPLFNMNGEVIGINSQIYSGTGGYQGLSFAIPIDIAMRVEKQLVHGGKVNRGHIGVTIQDVNQALAESFGLPATEGVLIAAVEIGGPADKAGLEAGDVVLKLDGQTIKRTLDLAGYIADLKPGTTSLMDVWRNGAFHPFTVTASEIKPPQTKSTSVRGAGGDRLGVAVRELDTAELSEAHLRYALLVEEVSGAAQRSGLRPGDLILAANGSSLKNLAELRALVKQAGKSIALLVQRDDVRLFVPISLG